MTVSVPSFLQTLFCGWPGFLPSRGQNTSFNPLTVTAKDLQKLLEANTVTSLQLVNIFLEQIDTYDDLLHAVLETNPDARRQAAECDRQRKDGFKCGPLFGIPILIKDNIATHPKMGMKTTGGSFALKGSRPAENAAVINRVLEAGMIIIGKAQLSELAGFKGVDIMAGWSAIGGQCRSAYVSRLDPSEGALGHSSPAGSSTGCAVGISAGYAPLAIGTDTGGSLITPSTRAALYTLRPTMGLVSQDGLIPICKQFDTAGPMAKSVSDLANLLDVMVPADKRSHSYSDALTGSIDNMKIGFLSPDDWYFGPDLQQPVEMATAQIKSETRIAYEKLGRLAKSFKKVSLISVGELEISGSNSFYTLQIASFKTEIHEYLKSLEKSKVRSLDDIIKYNEKHASKELPKNYGNQKQLRDAARMVTTKYEREALLEHTRNISKTLGIDKTLKEFDVDVIIAPADSPVNLLVSAAGYPSATMPLPNLKYNNRPIGLVAFTTAHGEDKLLQLLSAFELHFPKRIPPCIFPPPRRRHFKSIAIRRPRFLCDF